MSTDPIKVIDEKCVGCTLCTKVCPFGAIEMDERLAVIDLTKCTVCGACVEACKFEAIEMRERVATTEKDLSQYKDGWVLAEQFDGHIESVTYELLGEGRKLADDLQMDLCAVLLGSDIEAKAQDLISRGADRVYVCPQGHRAFVYQVISRVRHLNEVVQTIEMHAGTGIRAGRYLI